MIYMADFKGVISVRADRVYIQETYVDESVLSHIAFHIRGAIVVKRNEQRVAIGIVVSTSRTLII